jgi:hypothetical protein
VGIEDRDWLYPNPRRRFGERNPQASRRPAMARPGFLILVLAGVVAGALLTRDRSPIPQFPVSPPLIVGSQPGAGEFGTPWPFPSGGAEVRHVQRFSGLYGPLTIVAPRGDAARHFAIRVRDWYDKTPVTTLYFRSGDAFEVDIPVGAYRLSFAEGNGWLGYDRLFGKNTIFTEGVQPVVIAPGNGRVTGFRLVMELQPAGNFYYLPSSASFF